MNVIKHANCFDVFDTIQTSSIDAIIADLPYGTTKCKWDSLLPLNDYILSTKHKRGFLYKNEFLLDSFKNDGLDYSKAIEEWNTKSQKGLWYHYNRITKPHSPIILFSQAPFTQTLGSSNLKNLRYEWIWEKTQATGHLNAKKMPMKAHENILVFYKKLPTYNPQKTRGHVLKTSSVRHKRGSENSKIYGKQKATNYSSTERYPRSVLKFKADKQKLNLHPTQKPLKLMEYFVKTYTNVGDIVLDNVAGSGTTGVACSNLNRNYFLIEKDGEFIDTIHERLNLTL